MRFLQAARRTPGHGLLWLLMAWTVCQRTVWIALKLLYRVKLIGAERVPATGPVIYVCNHQSLLDPAIIGLLVRDRPFAAMARRSLFDFGPFALIIRFLRAIPVRRGESDPEAIRALLGELKAGRCILLFAEGTRSLDGTVSPFKAGAMLMVRRSKASVLPIAVEGAHDIWPKGRSFPRLHGRLAVIAGDPIDAATLLAMSTDAALDHLRRTIETLRLEARAELRRASGGRVPAPGAADRPFWGEAIRD